MSNSTLTSNKNLLSPLGFRLTIDATKYANVEFFLTQVSIPDVSLGEIQVDYRNTRGYLAGDKIDFSPLVGTFKIDEDMENYKEVFNWIKGNKDGSVKNDIILHITNSNNNINNQIRFTDAFPTNLSNVQFDIQGGSVEYLNADVTFRYDLMEFL